MVNEEQKRAARDQRRPNPPGIMLNENDIDVIDAVYRSRVLSQAQLATWFFKHHNYAQRRLRLLYDHGYLDRQFLLARGGIMNSPVLYLLDERGRDVLIEHRGYETVRWKASYNEVGIDFLQHTLQVNECHMRVSVACRDHEALQLVQWVGESELKSEYDYLQIMGSQGRRKRVSLIPDSYFLIETPRGKTHFFLELDRSTMKIERFVEKVLAYKAYKESGLSEKRYNTKLFRVLTVTKSQERAENLKMATEAATEKDDTYFWFAALDSLPIESFLQDGVWMRSHRSGRHVLIPT